MNIANEAQNYKQGPRVVYQIGKMGYAIGKKVVL